MTNLIYIGTALVTLSIASFRFIFILFHFIFFVWLCAGLRFRQFGLCVDKITRFLTPTVERATTIKTKFMRAPSEANKAGMPRSLMTMTYPKCQYLLRETKEESRLRCDCEISLGISQVVAAFESFHFLRSVFYRAETEIQRQRRIRECAAVHNWKISSFRFIYLILNAAKEQINCFVHNLNWNANASVLVVCDGAGDILRGFLFSSYFIIDFLFLCAQIVALRQL